MLNTQDQIITEFLVEMNQSTTVGFYTDTILNNWSNKAYTWATSAYKWPMTQGRQTTLWTGSEENVYPENWKPDSIRLLQLGGKRLQELNFEDYQIFREENASSTDRVFANFGGLYFINPNVDSSGTTTAWGQFFPAVMDWTVGIGTQTTIFSGTAEEANEAILEKMLSYAAMREKGAVTYARGHLIGPAALHEQNAEQILAGVWKRVTDEQFKAQGKNRGMWKRIDVLAGATRDELIKRDQFYVLLPFLFPIVHIIKQLHG